jgi:hypothetical protein
MTAPINSVHPTTIYFDEERHKYTDEFSNDYISVTTILGTYAPKFDAKEKARQCYRAGLRGNPKYSGKTLAQIEAQWDNARIKGCDTGNVKHNYLETAIKGATNYKRGASNFINGHIYTIADVIQHPGYGEVQLDYFQKVGLDMRYPDIYDTIAYLSYQGYRIYAEIGAFSYTHLISGLIDVFLIKDGRFIIIDWKTNKAPLVFIPGYWEKDRNGFLTGKFIENTDMMLPPVAYVPASQGHKYTFQLSLYARLAEMLGLVCDDLLLFHIITDEHTLEERVEFHPIKYMKPEIDLILKDREFQVHSLQSQFN